MINKDLYDFVASYQKKELKIKDSTEIREIIDPESDTEEALINTYSTKFGVDITNLDRTRHFSPNTPHFHALTVGDLAFAASIGSLDSAIIEASKNDINIAEKQSTRTKILAIIICIVTAILLILVALYI